MQFSIILLIMIVLYSWFHLSIMIAGFNIEALPKSKTRKIDIEHVKKYIIFHFYFYKSFFNVTFLGTSISY